MWLLRFYRLALRILIFRNGAVVDAQLGTERITLAEIARIAYFRSDTLPRDVSAQLTVSHHFAPNGFPFAFTNRIKPAMSRSTSRPAS